MSILSEDSHRIYATDKNAKFGFRTLLTGSLWLIVIIIGLLVVVGMEISQPALQVKYTAQELASANLSDGTTTGFYPVQSDAAGNQYVWTDGHPTLLLNLRTT